MVDQVPLLDLKRQNKACEAELRSGVSDGEIVVARSGSFVRDGDIVLSVPAPQSSAR